MASLSPHEFAKKWQDSRLKERSGSQEHFTDLCRMLGHATPGQADPEGRFFTFEKDAAKHGGGEGWADVWYKDHFAWEYKGKHANLDAAYDQPHYVRAVRRKVSKWDYAYNGGCSLISPQVANSEMLPPLHFSTT